MSYRNDFLDLLEAVCGTRNVVDFEYYQIDETTKIEDIDCTGFCDPKTLLLPFKMNRLIEDYIKTPLP